MSDKEEYTSDYPVVARHRQTGLVILFLNEHHNILIDRGTRPGIGRSNKDEVVGDIDISSNFGCKNKRWFKVEDVFELDDLAKKSGIDIHKYVAANSKSFFEFYKSYKE